MENQYDLNDLLRWHSIFDPSTTSPDELAALLRDSPMITRTDSTEPLESDYSGFFDLSDEVFRGVTWQDNQPSESPQPPPPSTQPPPLIPFQVQHRDFELCLMTFGKDRGHKLHWRLDIQRTTGMQVHQALAEEISKHAANVTKRHFLALDVGVMFIQATSSQIKDGEHLKEGYKASSKHGIIDEFRDEWVLQRTETLLCNQPFCTANPVLADVTKIITAYVYPVLRKVVRGFEVEFVPVLKKTDELVTRNDRRIAQSRSSKTFEHAITKRKNTGSDDEDDVPFRPKAELSFYDYCQTSL